MTVAGFFLDTFSFMVFIEPKYTAGTAPSVTGAINSDGVKQP